MRKIHVEIEMNSEKDSVELYEITGSDNINNEVIWEGYPFEHYCDKDFIIRFSWDSADNKVQKIWKGDMIETSEVDIRDQITQQFIKQEQERIEQTLSGLEDTIEYHNDVEEELDPYDPELIRVEPRQLSVKYIYEMMTNDDKELDLSPDFQRNFVWNDITRKSRLIESLLLRIPLPVFYFTQDKEGKYQVVDGVQRLTVIKSFISNEFKLKNLEYLKECEGRYFNKEGVDKKLILDPKYIRRINSTQLSCNIIDPQTPAKVKFDIFRRINTGGKTLNRQEIRNCLATTSSRAFLKRLAESDEFIRATNGSVSSTRMADHELVLRFIAFYYSRRLRVKDLLYKGDMEAFLDKILMVINDENEKKLEIIERDFYNSMNNAAYLFGKFAFRKCRVEEIEPGAKQNLLNKSLFITISTLLCEYDHDKIRERFPSEKLIRPFAIEIGKDIEYYDVLTNGTSDHKRLNFSFRVAEHILKRELGGPND